MLLLISSAVTTAIFDDGWTRLTVYHTNEANYSSGDIANMNTADSLGDLEFTIRAKLKPFECATPDMAKRAPYDCENPEQDATDLAITKLTVDVKTGTLNSTYCPWWVLL